MSNDVWDEIFEKCKLTGDEKEQKEKKVEQPKDESKKEYNGSLHDLYKCPLLERVFYAKNSKNKFLLHKLAEDVAFRVRFKVANNLNASVETLSKLSRDKDYRIRLAASNTLKKISKEIVLS